MSNDYRMPRGWLDHPVFEGKKEPYCRRAAWVWLIEEARYKDHDPPIGMTEGGVKRAQVRHSLRFIAKAWGWDDSRVRRFIKKLKDCGLIDAETDASSTVITIRNYDVFSPNGRKADAATDAGPTQDRRSIDANLKKGKKEETKEYIVASDAAAPAVVGCADGCVSDFADQPKAEPSLFGEVDATPSKPKGRAGKKAKSCLETATALRDPRLPLFKQFYYEEMPKRIGGSKLSETWDTFRAITDAGIATPERLVEGARAYRLCMIRKGACEEDGRARSDYVKAAQNFLSVDDKPWETYIDLWSRIKDKPDSNVVSFNNKPQQKRLAYVG